MMMRASEIKNYLKLLFPSFSFYVGTLDKKSTQCIGIYSRRNANSIMAIGGVGNSSFNVLPIDLVIHWTQDSDLCEGLASNIYETLKSAGEVHVPAISNDAWNWISVPWKNYSKSWDGINYRRVSSFKMVDNGPINLSRDDNNICEMMVRVDVIYDMEVIENG